MTLEKMSDFFAARINGYDEHMLSEIEGAREFYPYTASLLPTKKDSKILDLGCGTGLELEFYFQLNGDASVTGVDLSAEMLEMLQGKFSGRKINLIRGSYFDVSFGENRFDAAVSVESLHHFTAVRKSGFYKKLHEALTENGYFVLTDYFAESDEKEKEFFHNLMQYKKEQGISDDEFYHYDTPLTAEHEMEILRNAGFKNIRIMKKWGATYTLIAEK